MYILSVRKSLNETMATETWSNYLNCYSIETGFDFEPPVDKILKVTYKKLLKTLLQ